MPELPEVAHITHQVRSVLLGSEYLNGNKLSGNVTLPVCSSPVVHVTRRGKYIIIGLSPGSLIIHLGMTGQIHAGKPGEALAEGSSVRAHLFFSAATLTYSDTRGFGNLTYYPPGETPGGLFPQLGNDYFTHVWNRQQIVNELSGRAAPIKTLLLGQRHIAGIGNYIADEALHIAGIHPQARELTHAQACRVTDSVEHVFRRSTATGGVSMRDYQHTDGSRGTGATRLAAYGKAGQPCRACGNTLIKIRVAARGTTFCPTCQPEP
jgi:formamidopyrimidine-DNA glycosylase